MTGTGPLRFGYGTNGFANHRLDDALGRDRRLGYTGVALTLDHPHLDPFAADLAARTAGSPRGSSAGLAWSWRPAPATCSTRWRKHHPTLVSAGGASGGSTSCARGPDRGRPRRGGVSFWSGILPAGTPPRTGWHRLVAGTARSLEDGRTPRRHARPSSRSRACSWTRSAGVARLRRRARGPGALRVTLDVGHCVCVSRSRSPACVRRRGPTARQRADRRHAARRARAPGVRRGRAGPARPRWPRCRVGYTGWSPWSCPGTATPRPDVAARALTALRAAERTGAGAAPSKEPRDEGRPGARHAGSRRSDSAERDGRGGTADPARIAVPVPAVARRRRGARATRRSGRPRVRRRRTGRGSLLLWPPPARPPTRRLWRPSTGTATPARSGPCCARSARCALRWPATGAVAGRGRPAHQRTAAGRRRAGPVRLPAPRRPAWRQGVLKCLFTGVPLAAVDGLDRRADAELARMVAGYAAERRAAGRPVPADVAALMTHAARERLH